MDVLAYSSAPGFKPMLKDRSAPLNVTALPIVPSDLYEIVAVSDVQELNQNPQIAFYDGLFIATWVWSAGSETAATQGMFSTSADGMTWSPRQSYTGVPPSGFRYSTNGLWLRNGELWALYYFTEINPDPVEGEEYYGPSLKLMGRLWQNGQWGTEQEVLTDCMLDYAPIQLPDGNWLGSGRNHKFETQFILGDLGNWERVIVPSPAGVLLNEATVLSINPRLISYEYRNEDEMNPRVLLRSFSYDGGRTVSTPMKTNFPDAQSRRAVMRLSDGRYVLSSNASQEMGRQVLMLSVSDDGLEYDRVYVLRNNPEPANFTGTGYWSFGFNYPQLLEKDGYLWVIYSQNKEDIQISRVSLGAFD